jgi:hypothetical protein
LDGFVELVAIQPGVAVSVLQSTGGEQGRRLGIYLMFDGLNAG